MPVDNRSKFGQGLVTLAAQLRVTECNTGQRRRITRALMVNERSFNRRMKLSGNICVFPKN